MHVLSGRQNCFKEKLMVAQILISHIVSIKIIFVV